MIVMGRFAPAALTVAASCAELWMIFLAASGRVSTATVDIQNFAVLPQVWQPPVLEHIGRQAGESIVRFSCGYWCNAEITSIRHGLADASGLPPSQLGDLRLQTTADVLSDHESWVGLAIVHLDASKVGVASRWLNADGSTQPDQVSLYGSAVLMPMGARISFASPVKLAVIPVLQHPRPLWDYYVGSALWEPLVATHHTSSALGLAFFREHTAHPLKWHAFTWVFLGVVCLLALMLSAVHYTRPGTVETAAEIVATTAETAAKTMSLSVAAATTGLIARGRAGVIATTMLAATTAKTMLLIVATATTGLIVRGRAGVTTMIALHNRCRRSRSFSTAAAPSSNNNPVAPAWLLNKEARSRGHQSRPSQNGSARRCSPNQSPPHAARWRATMDQQVWSYSNENLAFEQRATSPRSPKTEDIDCMA